MTGGLVLLLILGIGALLLALASHERWLVLMFGLGSGFAFGQLVSLLQFIDTMFRTRP